MKQKFIITICAAAGIASALLIGYSSSQHRRDGGVDSVISEVESQNIQEDVIEEYSINFFGDLLMHNTVYNAAKVDNTYDFTNIFADIASKVTDADMTVGNLETSMCGAELGYSSYPCFNTPEQLADTLKDTLDVELVSTATNHSLDKGFRGLVNSLNFLDDVNIAHIGTYADEESSNDIYIKELDSGIKIAFLNYTYGTNGIPIPSAHPYCVNIISKDKIKSDSEKATELGGDYIIAKLHWGNEYQTTESEAQKDLAKYIFENTNISLIVGDHPHVVQNIEQMTVNKDGIEKTGTVIYSLGNFVSDQRATYKNSGIIAKVNFLFNKTNPSETKIVNIEYTPVYVDRNPNSTTKKYRVVDVNEAIANYENGTDSLISKAEYDELIHTRDYYRNKLLQDDFVIEN